MPIYFAWFTTALLSVGGDANDQNLPQSGRLLYCVIMPVPDTYLEPDLGKSVQLAAVLINNCRSRSSKFPSVAFGFFLYFSE
jgi:hypothetical protein